MRGLLLLLLPIAVAGLGHSFFPHPANPAAEQSYKGSPVSLSHASSWQQTNFAGLDIKHMSGQDLKVLVRAYLGGGGGFRGATQQLKKPTGAEKNCYFSPIQCAIQSRPRRPPPRRFWKPKH